MEYIRSLSEENDETGCFLCHYWATPDRDTQNRVILRGRTGFVVMNRFPYNNGHLLIACAQHKSGYDELAAPELLEMQELTREAITLLRRTINPQGFNVGVNLGRCAGAGLPDHMHAHVVPRWAGDTNYMAVIGEARVIPEGLDALYRELRANVAPPGMLPGVAGG